MPIHTFSFVPKKNIISDKLDIKQVHIEQHPYSLLEVDKYASNPENILLIDFYLSGLSINKEIQICTHILELTSKYNTQIFIVSPSMNNETLLDIELNGFQILAHYLSNDLVNILNHHITLS